MGPARLFAAVVAVAACLAVASPALADPPGANDWSCRPTAAHPRPVVLVHGTFADATVNWAALSPRLKQAGYCVYALDYGDSGFGSVGVYATGRVSSSAAELGAFIDRVLAATGAGQVDIVGHSQGGMMPREYIREFGAAKVHTLVGLSPSNHGTTASGFLTLVGLVPAGRQVLAAGCPACDDQTVGSPFLATLNAAGDTVPGVSYTVIQTRYDEVVTPYTSAFLAGATNITLQDGCALDTSEHLSIAFDPRALQYVLNALDPATAKRPPCGLFTPPSR
jgi:triacylglycerol esterase/lipase EstA (alpha/beta hydrolase family)